MTEPIITLAFGFTSVGLAVSWLAWRAISLDVTSPDRLVIELRLAQITALLLVLAAGVYVGAAVTEGSSTGAGLDIALAIGFFIVAALATTWEPSSALTTLAAAWCAHGLMGWSTSAMSRQSYHRHFFPRGTQRHALYTMYVLLVHVIFLFLGDRELKFQCQLMTNKTQLPIRWHFHLPTFSSLSKSSLATPRLSKCFFQHY